MTTLVTGATGFACAHVVRALAEAGETVVALDLVPASAEYRQFLAAFEDRVQFVSGDVLNTAGLLDLAERYAVRRFVHGAAITPTIEVERSIPERIMNVNLMGTVSMLEVARKVSAERVVVMSSSGVYAPLKDRDRSVSEDSPVEARGLYAICKYGSELVSRRYKSLFGLSTVTGRMDSIYGPMERATASRSRPSIIYLLIRACLARRPVRVRGSALRRSFTHAEDAGVIWRHLTLAADLDHDVYNVSTGVAYTLSNVLETLQSLEPTFSYCNADSGQSADVEITADSERGAPDITRARADFGFTPKYDLRHGLDSYLAWARDHPALFQ